jgi:Predicted membrane protein
MTKDRERRYCGKCGAPFPDNDNYCGLCGSYHTEISVQESAILSNKPQSRFSISKSEKIALISILSVFLIVFTCAFVFTGNDATITVNFKNENSEIQDITLRFGYEEIGKVTLYPGESTSITGICNINLFQISKVVVIFTYVHYHNTEEGLQPPTHFRVVEVKSGGHIEIDF